MAEQASGPAFTPQVREFLVCDQILTSEVEAGVFTLEGMREGIIADSFPHSHSLSVFLRLYYARGGTFRGKLFFSHSESGRVLAEIELRPSFGGGPAQVVMPIDVGDFVFDSPGLYGFELFFWDPQGQRIQRLGRDFVVAEAEG